MKDYKDTLHMPKTAFPMRGNLGKREPERQKFWEENKIYDKRLAKNEGNETFTLPDGPPYANGDIHIGTAMNKALKDIIVRDRSMRGFYTRYVPGWDTHGLPIESALTKNEGVDRKALTVAEFRKKCEDYALGQVVNQRAQFKRIGILGEWEDPYLTLDKHYEASELEIFADMVEKGLVFKGLKPVYWSPSSETALAEAEIEYADKRSPAIYFTFDAVDTGVYEKNFKFLAWTTTPWTIPANLATAVSEEIDYVFSEADGEVYVFAAALEEEIKEKLGFQEMRTIRHVKGKDLISLTYKHPLYDRVSPIVSGHHVSVESGTGLVHIAPGHGEDDFLIGQREGLEVFCPVDERGHMTKEAGRYEGMFVEKCSKEVVKDLEEKGNLLKMEWIEHSYPHDWRTKKPVIFRATDQWFASVESLKEDLLREVERIEWIPSWGKVRMENMIKDRESWCISRQRTWGVPIPVFYHENKEAILDADIIRHVARLFEKHGSNIWFEWDAKDLLPEGFASAKSPNGRFTKETDILDVWFDSGTSHKGGMTDKGLPFPADLYLEGSDQYRGWFNSSLSTAVASRGESPYLTCLTHGFVVDAEGRKMSKSLGNVVNPLKVMDELGADILRLWVASVDYQADVRISDKMMKQIAENYRKIRNTFRFMLGVLSGFDIERDGVAYEEMDELDRYILLKLDDLVDGANAYYDRYMFDDVMRIVNRFVTNDLSAFYLDIIKDIVYIEKQQDKRRLSALTVVYRSLSALVRILTPIIPHTTEEAYQHFPNKDETSVYLENMPKRRYPEDASLKKKYDAFMALRDRVLKSLEDARNEKRIGGSLEARIKLYPAGSEEEELLRNVDDLARLFIVSEAEIASEGEGAYKHDALTLDVEKAEGAKCERCWKIGATNDEGVCSRCEDVLAGNDRH